MGIDFYIQGFQMGEPSGVEVLKTLQAFGLTARDEKNGVFSLEYDEENSCEIKISQVEGITTEICIFRPCEHEALNTGIITVLKSGPYVLFASDGHAPIIGDLDTYIHLPGDMADALGDPVVVNCADDVFAALYGS